MPDRPNRIPHRTAIPAAQAIAVLVLAVVVRQPACAEDGQQPGINAAAAQFPDLLRIYATRPAWKVAGVDFPVGIPAGTVLRSPETIARKGVAVRPREKHVGISASDVELDGYDFSGWQVELLAGATNLTIRRSKFLARAGEATAPIFAYFGGSVRLLNNLIVGGGASSTANPLFSAGTGGALVAYNVFSQVPNDAINITHDGVYDIHNNLFESLNYGEGHTDCVQTFFSPITRLRVSYNTVFQPPPLETGYPGGGNAFVRVGDEKSHTVRGVEIDHNTLVFRGVEGTKFANVFDVSAGDGQVIEPAIHDNFVDPTGILYGIWAPFHATLTDPIYYGNIDLQTGRELRASAYNSQSAGVPAAVPASPRIVGVRAQGASMAIRGTAAPGTKVHLMSDGAALAAVPTSPDGTWTLTANGSPSPQSITARATDGIGNAGPPSNLANSEARVSDRAPAR